MMVEKVVIIDTDTRAFLKGHFEKKIKCPPHHLIGGYLGRSYPEGEADQTSLGGWHWHLKFDHF